MSARAAVAAPAGPSPAEPLTAALTATARSRPGLPALILPGAGWPPPRPGRERFRTVSYAELDRRSDAIAAGLVAVGIGAGVRTALMVPLGPDFFAVAFALLKARAVPVLIDPGIGRRHLRACLAEVAPEAFIGVPRAHLARRALGWAPTAHRLVTVGARLPGGWAGTPLREVERDGAALPATAPPSGAPRGVAPGRDRSDDRAPAAIAFTSGSTGPPKGVEYRAGHFAAQVRMIRELYDVRPGQVSLATFPPFALLGPALGLTTVVPRMDPTRPARVDPRRLAEAADRHGATLMFGSPALLDTVSRWGQATGAQLPTLRQVVSAGAPVSRGVQRRVLAMLPPGAQVHTPYGATEALPVTSASSSELLALPEAGICVGRPAPGVEIALVQVTDEALPVLHEQLRVPEGEVGEIVVRGPNVTERYAERPRATALAKTDWAGWVAHRMGDLGRLDGAGRLWFHGRKVHRVTTEDGPMDSVPCEEVFNAHPAVARSALVGLGPPGRARPVVCVERERGARRLPPEQLSAQLLALAAAHPEAAGVRAVLYRRRLPVDIRHNAKIDREALARWAARRLGHRDEPGHADPRHDGPGHRVPGDR